jgi:cytochrome c556
MSPFRIGPRAAWPTIRVLCALALLAAGTARADTREDAERAIHYRHSVYHVIEWNVAAMHAAVTGAVPYDPAAFAMRAGRVATLVPMLLEGFTPNSYLPGHTLAKEAVWSHRAEFEELLNKLGTRSTALAEVAKGGDLNAIRPVFNELTQTCKECHKRFKEKGEH